MSDLVQRLLARRVEVLKPNADGITVTITSTNDPLCVEAAREIARLREALQQIDARTVTQSYVRAARTDPALLARQDLIEGAAALAAIGDIARTALALMERT